MKRSFQLRPTKVKAFTIVEVIITLILISLIFSMSIGVYRVVFEQQNRYFETINTQMNHLNLSTTLNSDMLTCEYLIREEDGVVFVINENNEITYLIIDQLVIRENEVSAIDSFELKGLQVHYYFEETSVYETGKLVDRIELEYYHDDLKVNVAGNKNYDSSTLVKLNY